MPASRLVQVGDVLVNSTGEGTLGRVAQLREKPMEPTTVDSHVTIVRPKPGLFVQDFFGYALMLLEDDIKKAGEGCGGQTELARSFLAERLTVHFPESHREQKRIVALLDEAFDAIASAKASATLASKKALELFHSYREEALSPHPAGWASARLSELCAIKHGFAFQSRFFATKGKYVLLTPGNFFEAGGYRDRGEKQKYYVGDVPDGFVLSKGDLLVAMTEQAAGLLGSPILVPESDTFLHNQRLGLVTPLSGVPWLNEFFFHVFNTSAFRQAIHAGASGVKVRHTSPTKIGQAVVSFPTSIDKQKALVANLDEVLSQSQVLYRTYERRLAEMEGLAESLLWEAFGGHL